MKMKLNDDIDYEDIYDNINDYEYPYNHINREEVWDTYKTYKTYISILNNKTQYKRYWLRVLIRSLFVVNNSRMSVMYST